ncbi:MAG: ABC transporter permease [Dehalococcoidia bacterium]
MATQAGAILEDYSVRPEVTRGQRYWRALAGFVRYKPMGAICGAIVIILVVMAIFPGLFATHSPQDRAGITNEFRLQSPSGEHWFGTDNLGRDLYSRIVYGARTSIVIGFGIVILSQGVALLIGLLSGYVGGWFDTIFQRIIDVGIALPGLIFIILVVVSLQQIPVTPRIILSLGALIALSSSRVIRGSAIAAKQNVYVEAARVLGANDVRIMARHVLPNLMAVVIVSASIQVGRAILIEASLSFLGYGVPPPTPSWGWMVNEAREFLARAPHMAIFPGLAIFVVVYSFNMFGDALRDVLDPRMRGTR